MRTRQVRRVGLGAGGALVLALALGGCSAAPLEIGTPSGTPSAATPEESPSSVPAEKTPTTDDPLGLAITQCMAEAGMTSRPEVGGRDSGISQDYTQQQERAQAAYDARMSVCVAQSSTAEATPAP